MRAEGFTRRTPLGLGWRVKTGRQQVAKKGIEVAGVLEVDERQGGWLRSPDSGYQVDSRDPRLPPALRKTWRLIGGETLTGHARPSNGQSRSAAPELVEIDTINGADPRDYLEVPAFEDLTPIEPRQQMRFETEGGALSMRIVDLMTPIGFGQRGLIAAPPRTGKTILLQQMAHGAAQNYPDLNIMVLLIDERPEEVTDMRRKVQGEVIASSNDKDLASHVRVARLVIARAKRLVEGGQDVLVLLDSLTRLGRAFNAYIRSSGRIMSGGLDIRALAEPKSVFGAARNIENGGSLTIIASALIETGSRMDDVIFSEFKGTGNMEIMLSRNLANKRLWPALDLDASGTRKEELLLTPEALAASHAARRTLAGRDPERAMEAMLEDLGKYPDNAAYAKAHAAANVPLRRR